MIFNNYSIKIQTLLIQRIIHFEYIVCRVAAILESPVIGLSDVW